MFERLSTAFSSLIKRFAGEKKLTITLVDELLTKVHDALIDADVPYAVAEKFLAELRPLLVGKQLSHGLKAEEQIMKVVYDAVVSFLGDNTQNFAMTTPSSILIMGLQGSGKTTTITKVAHYLQREAHKQGKKRKILVASVDFYRPAAVDQLEINARKAQIDFYRSPEKEVLSASRDIVSYAHTKGYDHLLVDTAGRLHIDNDMLKELQQLKAIIQPRYSLMVLDSMMGQQSLTVAEIFHAAIGFDAGILTKMDSDTRGGVAFAFRSVVNKPLLFIGIGERSEDFELYQPKRIAGRMLNMGDLLSLAEQAEEKIKAEDRKKAEEAFTKGHFTLDDFASQLAMMGKLGPLSRLAQYMPGMGNMQLNDAQVRQGEIVIKKYRAIMNSMTRKERLVPAILNASRKKRIAQGAGMQVQDVNELLTRFEQMQQFVKLMKMGGMSRMFKN
jgi:signal recognition particle subunit SRP54